MAQVIVYTQPGCGACEKEKAWLKEKGVAFEDRDIRANAAYMREIIELGARATPVTVIEGEGKREVVMGFDVGRLAKSVVS